MGTIAAAAMMRKQRDIVAAFRAAAATSAGAAKTPSALGIHEGLAFRKLRRRAVLRDAGNGGLYLDEPTWEALRVVRRRLAVLLLAFAMALGATAFYMANRP